MPEVVDNPLRLVGAAASRVAAASRPHRAARPRRRDRLGQGGARGAGGLPGPGHVRRPRAADDCRDSRRRLRRVRGGQAPGRPARLRRPAADHGRRDRGVRATSPRRSGPGTGTSSSTSTRTSRRVQQRLLDAWLGGRDDLCVVGDANQTIYSFAGATPEHLLSLYPSVPRRRGRAAASRLPVDAAGGRAGEPARRCGRAERWRTAASIGRPAPGRPAADLRRVRRRAGRGRRRRRALPRADRRRNAGGRDRGAVPGQRPVGGLRAGVGRRPGVPYVLRGGERFFDRPEIREARLLLAGRCAGGRRRGDAARRGARRPRQPGLAPGRSADRRRRPGTVGVAWPRWSAWPTTWSRWMPHAHLPELVAELDQRAAAQHAPTVQGVTLASLHAAKGLEWDAVFLVGLTDGTVPDPAREHRGSARRGTPAALRRHDPGPRAARRCRGRWPAAPGSAAAAGRAGSSTACARLQSQTPRRSKRKSRPQADDAELFGRLRAWRKRQAEALSVPAYVVFSDATLVADFGFPAVGSIGIGARFRHWSGQIGPIR